MNSANLCNHSKLHMSSDFKHLEEMISGNIYLCVREEQEKHKKWGKKRVRKHKI